MREKRSQQRTQEPRAFVHPSKRLTEQEIGSLEELGFIPVQNELGETTRLVNVRLDSRNMNKLRILKKRLEASEKRKFSDSEVLRFALVKGIKLLMKETLAREN
ncbi:MAG: hypothetical protein QMD43_09930 [Thermodesulfovibrio sp.]|nr:hypothetical protein [Thermodesulfovibrio sp.]